jgi:hypothetical protein
MFGEVPKFGVDPVWQDLSVFVMILPEFWQSVSVGDSVSEL